MFVARHVLPLPTSEANAVKRQIADQLASARVSRNYLGIAVLALALTNVGSVVGWIKAVQAVQNFRPVVIRVNDMGRPAAEQVNAGVYAPREAEMKYFLGQFVANYYGRIRSTVRDQYTRALYFLDTPLARGIVEANRKTKLIETFLAGAGDEIDIRIKNVTIEDLRSAPYRATVDFEKLYYGPDHQETKRESYTASFVFSVKDRVPNNLILINPLGFTITYFREDQAFE